VIEGWIWVASLSSSRRTCAACIALNGTFHTLDERMQNHVMCRCVQAPAVRGSRLNIQKGSDWFAQQPAEVQKEILDKPGQYEAYRSGKLRLEDFVGIKRSAQWGDSYRVLSLKEALAGEGSFPADPARISAILPARLPQPETRTLLSFAQSPPSGIQVEYGPAGRDAVRLIFGRDLEDSEIGHAVGAFDGARLVVTGSRGRVSVDIYHEWIDTQERSIYLSGEGIEMRNNYFIKSGNAPSGVGIRSFARQVFGARRLGIKKITTYAAGHRGHRNYNGYYTWARLGYNADLYRREMDALPAHLRGSRDLHDLFSKPGGAEWWREYGDERSMEFSLDGRSKSMRRLLKYLREKEERS
jgi:hypothetical protein